MPEKPQRSKGTGSRAFDQLWAIEAPKPAPPATGLCVAPGTESIAVADANFAAGEYGNLIFAPDEHPAWLADGLVLLSEGRVIGLHFSTAGFEAQSRVMELLERKFGTPDTQTTSQWNERWGGNRDSIIAKWHRPGLFVDYVCVVQAHGLSGGIGSLDIGNEQGQEAMETTRKEAEF